MNAEETVFVIHAIFLTLVMFHVSGKKLSLISELEKKIIKYFLLLGNWILEM